jgi:hypothetical protein
VRFVPKPNGQKSTFTIWIAAFSTGWQLESGKDEAAGPVPLPGRLPADLRRGSRLGISQGHLVEWNGKKPKGQGCYKPLQKLVGLGGLEPGTRPL